MSSSTSRRLKVAAFLLLDVLAIGAGMGVPIFAIAFGFLVGWLLPGFLDLRLPLEQEDLGALLRASVATSIISLLVLSFIWLPTLRILADPSADLANFGIPMLLFDPLPSFIAWIILMVLISPALQTLTTLFGSVLRCAIKPSLQRGIAGA